MDIILPQGCVQPEGSGDQSQRSERSDASKSKGQRLRQEQQNAETVAIAKPRFALCRALHLDNGYARKADRDQRIDDERICPAKVVYQGPSSAAADVPKQSHDSRSVFRK